MQHLDVVVPERPEAAARQVDERLVPLHGVDVADDAGQHRGGVPGAGADLEHPGIRPRLDGGDHEGDDIRLRDRLPLLDRQRRVLVGELAQLVGHERLTRHHPHGVEDPFVAHAARGDLMLHHVLAQDARVRHESGLAARLVVVRRELWKTLSTSM